jgi:hypothetical protein
LAINITDGKLYYKDNTGTVKLLASSTAAGGTFTAPVVIEGTTTDAALRITQLGTGNALLVEDSTNPDATPFVIDANGQVVIGTTTSVSTANGEARLQVIGTTNATAQAAIGRFSNDVDRPRLNLYKSRSGTIGTNTIVQNNDAVGDVVFQGADGTSYVVAAKISTEIDGTPGTNDMPGRLTFSTTADGASSPTERMRIDSAGQVGIPAVVAGVNLRVNKSLTGATSTFGVVSSGTTQSDSTAEARMFSATGSTAASAFSLNILYGYLATQGTIGAGSIVNTNYGFHAGTALTGATNNFGFYGNIAAPTAGITTTGTISTISSSGTTVTVSHNAITYTNGQTVTIAATANATALVSGATATILTVGTTDYTLIGAASNTVGVSFTATGAGTGTGTVTLNIQGSGKTVAGAASGSFTYTTTTSQTFAAVTVLTGTVTVSTRFNLYMNGTAANYLGGDTIVNGKIGLGTAASPSYGTAGQVLTSAGSGASPTWSSASGGSSGASKSYVATGSLSSGQPVALRADGTVEGIYAENTNQTAVNNQIVATSTTVTNFFGSATSSSGSIVTFFANDTLNVGDAVVSTVSGTTVTSGALNRIYSGIIEASAVCYDSLNDKFVFIYKPGAATTLYAVVGTLSGTTISLGTPVAIATNANWGVTSVSATFDSINGKIVVTYTNNTISNAIVGTVSGTSISFGSPTQYATSSVNVSSCFHQAAGKVVLSYAISTSVYAIVGTVSGTSISFGTALSFGSTIANTGTAIVYDPVYTKVIVGWREGTNYVARAGVVSGTAIVSGSQGTLYTFNGGSGIFYGAYDYAAQQAVFAFSITGTTMAVWCSARTTTIVALPQVSLSTGGTTTKPTLAYDFASLQIIAFSRTTATVYASSIKQAFLSNSNYFFGITEAAISSGASGNITLLGGINNQQTGLTVESPYFLTTSATLSTTNAATSVYVGLALSPTEIQLGSTISSSPNSRNAGMVLLATATISSVLNVDFDDYFTPAYRNYMIVWQDVIFNNTTANDLKARLKFAGSYQAATASYTYSYSRIGDPTYFGARATQTSVELGPGTLPASNGTTTGSGYLYLFNPLQATKNKMVAGTSVGSSTTTGAGYTFSGIYTGASGTTACQGIRFFCTSSSMSGTFLLYGIV